MAWNDRSGLDDVRSGWRADIARLPHLEQYSAMTDYVWSYPERRDLYLSSRLLADKTSDGDWLQWSSDTLVEDLELYDDPRQGVGAWLFDDEVDLANELGERLWSIIGENPFDAAMLLQAEHTELREVARKLVKRIENNGRRTP